MLSRFCLQAFWNVYTIILIYSDPFGQQKCIQNSCSSLALTYHKLIYRTILKIQREMRKGMVFILLFKANVEATESGGIFPTVLGMNTSSVESKRTFVNPLRKTNQDFQNLQFLMKWLLAAHAWDIKAAPSAAEGQPCLLTHLPFCRLQVQFLPAGSLEVTCSCAHLDPTWSFHYQGPGWWFKPKGRQHNIYKRETTHNEQ